MTILLNQWKIKKGTTRAILSVVLLSTAHTQCMGSEGIYFGIGAGASFLYGKVKDASPIEPKKLRKHGDVASVFAGYNHTIKDTPMFTGIEAGFQNHAMKKRIDGIVPGRANPYMFSVSTNNSIVGHIKLGFTVTNISFYCKGGVAQTNFKTNYLALGREKETGFKKLGASTGIGVEAKFNKNFSMGVEHIYTKYGSLRGIAHDMLTAMPDMRIRFAPEIHVTSLRLIYNF
jgi:opacity protein-like surface antigen